jgi:hypothetical protein
MPYTAQFFAEKLNVQVEYFNPLRNIEIDPSLDLDDLSKYAHCLGEVVGLGLRELAHCPVELNLMPRSSLQRQEFGHKKIYLIASVFSIALVLFAIGRAEVDIAKVWQNKAGELQDPVSKLTQQNQKYQDLVASRDKLKRQADDMKALVEKRYYWIGVLTDLRGVMLQAEEAEKADLTKPENGGTNTDAGIWVEEFIPGMPAGYAAAVQMSGSGAGSGAPSRNYGPSAYELRRRNLAARSGQASSAAPGQAPTVMASGVEVNNLKLLCRSINRGVEANGHLEYSIRQLLTNCPTFTGPVVLGLPKVEGDTNTFSFEVTVGLAHPFKL